MNKLIEDIKCFCIDVDGTLTDGMYHIDKNGEISKSFYTRDFYAMNHMQKLGFHVQIVTQSKSTCAVLHAKMCKIPIWTGINDKFLSIDKNLSFDWNEIAFIGDAENDIRCVKNSLWSACPNDAIVEIKAETDYISNIKGGKGAVYDIMRYIVDQSENLDWI